MRAEGRAAVDRIAVPLHNGETVEFPRGWRQHAALELVCGGNALLDVGCGRGGVAAALRDRFQRVVGVDAHGPWLGVTAERGVEARQLDLDRELLPFADGEFDAVLCLEVIEHVVEPDRLTAELARVTRRGGRAYVSTPNVRHLRHLADLVLRGRFPLTSSDTTVGWQGGHLHFFTAADLCDLLSRTGFDHVDIHWLPLRRRGWRRALPAELVSAGLFAVARRGSGPAEPLNRTAEHESRFD
jgi:methionine biosynthesis protein MetW